jgi:hypothetical protein
MPYARCSEGICEYFEEELTEAEAEAATTAKEAVNGDAATTAGEVVNGVSTAATVL